MAREKILMGTERRSMVMSRREIENTAYHESGHAVVSLLLPSDKDPVHKVTIIPRGRALGVTMQLPTEDRYSVTKTYAENQIAVLMGGRIAEELAFSELTSGAGNDFERATELAQKMVRDWGMSSLGPLVYGRKEGEVFLGRDFTQSSDVSELTSQQIDTEVKRIVVAQYDRAKALLTANMPLLERMAKALLEYETIDTADIEKILQGKDITREKPTSRIKSREELIKERELASETGKTALAEGPLTPVGELSKA